MIRIEITETKLREEIAARSTTWLERAETTREHHERTKEYERATPKWSEIKGAYITAQKGRCAYCERELTIDEREGGGEWDVEHYRPKSSVSEWPTEAIKEERGIDYELPFSGGSSLGYYLLSHHPLNYVTSCKTCNSRLKGNYFPVAAQRLLHANDPKAMGEELPLLIYPLGSHDEDPEELIGFEGVLPRKIGATPHQQRRAEVTIDFFDLAGRPTLELQRARAITHLANTLTLRDLPGAPAAVVQSATRTLKAMEQGRHPHTNCIRSFMQLYEENRGKADEIAERARAIYERDPRRTASPESDDSP